MSNKRNSEFNIPISATSAILDKVGKGTAQTVITAIDKTGIRYYVGDSVLTEESIQKMKELGLLVQIGFIGLISCPSCGDHVLAVLPVCPRCNSNDVDIAELVAHVKCGYIGFLREFLRDGELVCPGCGKKIENSDTELRTYGRVFMCQNCGAKFETPSLKLRCLNCGLVFTLKEARIKRVPQYAIEASALEKARLIFVKDYVKNMIVNIADKYGIDVAFDVDLKGMSGVVHKIPVLLKRGSKEVIVYFILNERDATLFTSLLLDLPEPREMIVICDDNAVKDLGVSCSTLAAGKSSIIVIPADLSTLESNLEDAIRRAFRL
ncbi:MAG: hypothetical protein GXO23_04340 [Crenarchaeota archaeon]|nr:hypothetical protein [Thermoproteota archaeon]